MLMSLTTTARFCPSCPNDSWGTTSVVAIPVPFWFERNKLLTGQTPSPGSLAKWRAKTFQYTPYYTRLQAEGVIRTSTQDRVEHMDGMQGVEPSFRYRR